MIPKEGQGIKYQGFYRGKVVLNDETLVPTGGSGTVPNKWGRIKIRVYPMMSSETIQPVDLPWAVPAFPLAGGSGAGFGSFSIPQIDSMVWVFFEDGDPMLPVYFAEALDGTHGLPTWKDTNYPDRKGVSFKNGMEVWLDEKDNAVYLRVPSGTYFKIHGNAGTNHGKVESIIVDELEIDVDKDIKVTGLENLDVTIEKVGTIEIKTSTTIKTPVLSTDQNMEVGAAATGIFTSLEGRTVNVVKGIVVSIT